MLRHALDTIDRLFGHLVRALALLVAVSIGTFVVGIVADLTLRSLELGNISWLNEVLEYLLYAGVFLSAPWLLRDGAHVRVDIALAALPASWTMGWQRGLDALGAAVSGSLCYYGVLATMDAAARGAKQYKTLTLDTWWLLSIFAAATFLLAVEFLLRMQRPHPRREEPDGLAAVETDRTGF